VAFNFQEILLPDLSDFLPLSDQYNFFPMKKLSCFLVLLFIFSVLSTIAQPTRISPRITRAGKGKVSTMIDNIGYWQRMVRLGYVLANPRVTVPKPVFTGSLITANGVQTQDSPDQCVTGTEGLTQS